MRFNYFNHFLHPVTSREQLRQYIEILKNYQMKRFNVLLPKDLFITRLCEVMKTLIDRDPKIELDQIYEAFKTIFANMENIVVNPDDPEEQFLEDIRESKVTWDLAKRKKYLEDTKDERLNNLICSDPMIRKFFDYWLGAIEGGSPQYIRVHEDPLKYKGLFDEFGLYPRGKPEKEIQSEETSDNISREERKKEFFHRLEILNEFFEGREGWKKFDYEREMLTSFTPKVRAELITKNLSFDWSLFFKSAKSGDFKACEVIFFRFSSLAKF